jgi:anti-sigma factor RsiW
MNSPLDQFDAPELKSAVKRLYGNERAPLSLRERVEGILKTPQPQSRPVRIERAVMWRWAAAAVIAIGLAGLVVRVSYERRQPVGRQTLAAMVKTHDYCSKEGRPHRGKEIPHDSFVLVGSTMASKLKEPVLAADMGQGWRFMGGAMCPVNGKPSAHLVYYRNGQWLSVFSMPAASCEKVRDGAMCAEVIGDHMVAGFARTGGVYCMVATCPGKRLQLEEIRQLLKQHQGDLVAPREDRSVAMVEMLRQR